MQTPLPRSWKEEFAQAAMFKREEELHRERMAALQSNAKRREAEEKVREQRFERDIAVIESTLASTTRIADFTAKLDRYDTATVDALMSNQQALDAVRTRMDIMLGKAHVIEDGRRVFKTVDGEKVFDEHGHEIARDIIDPGLIDDRKPKWESFRDSALEKVRLMQEREGLLDYQGKLDLARERLDRGDITDRELDDLGKKLEADMPDIVRRKLGVETARPEASADNLKAPLTELPMELDGNVRQRTSTISSPSL